MSATLEREALASLYRERALAQAPRILGLGDREPASPTYGCFDRNHWHYALSDFANAQQQQAALYLAELARTHSYSHEARITQWSQAAISYWSKLPHNDGSLDEAYPNERGYCATALSTAAVAEAALALGIEPPRDALARAGRWLARAIDPPVANQVAGAALALVSIAELLKETTFEDAARAKLAALVASQDRDGFFPEYGGPDVGYQTLTLAFLGRIERRTRTSRTNFQITQSIERGASAVAARLDAHGRHEAPKNSRRSQFVYPSGLVAAGARDALARHRRGLEAGLALEPGWLDDRYVIWLATDYLIAARALEAGSA